MDKQVHQKITEWIKAHREELVADITRLCSIRSVATYEEPPTPFGRGCKQALEEMLQIGREHGFSAQNFEDYCGALWLDDTTPSIGFWGHLDIVPEGDDWDFEPFRPTEKDGFLIGRGVEDNKGPTLGVLYVIRCLKELGIPLRHGLKLFVGCDEEHGMKDVMYYTEHYDSPELVLIADSGFPVSYGEKGIMEGDIVSREPVSDTLIALTGGIASNVIPADASMVLRATPEVEAALAAAPTLPESLTLTRQAGQITLAAKGENGHSAGPQGVPNAIHRLMGWVVQAKLLPERETRILALMTAVNDTCDGAAVGIQMEDDLSGCLTCAGTMTGLRDRKVFLHMNIRYCITADSEQMLKAMEAACAQAGCTLLVHRDSRPAYFPRENPVIDALTGVFNELTGRKAEPFTMSGGTYARKLPNALGFGFGGLDHPEPTFLRPGHGGGHRPDEALYIDNLLEAMAILAMGLIEIDPMM